MKTLLSSFLGLLFMPVACCAAERWQPLWDGATFAGSEVIGKGQ